MALTPPASVSPALRVVVLTNIPGGVAYRLVADALQHMGHRVVGVLTTPGPRSRRSTAYLDVVAAVPPGIDVIVSNHPARWAAMLAPLDPELIISGGFPWLVPAEVAALPRLGAINLHPAPLPKYRGPFPLEWALRNGDPEMAFTVHRLAAEFDTGAILARGSVPILDDDAFDDVLARATGLIPGLLQEAIDRLTTGDCGDEQDEQDASYAGPFEPKWRIIDWSQPARQIHNKVRSWSGMRDMPRGAIGEIKGTPNVITRTRLIDAGRTGTALNSPGTVVSEADGRLVIQCGDGPLELIAWSPDGEVDG
jgi:methionyl-tRNA formyltransferase